MAIEKLEVGKIYRWRYNTGFDFILKLKFSKNNQAMVYYSRMDMDTREIHEATAWYPTLLDYYNEP